MILLIIVLIALIAVTTVLQLKGDGYSIGWGITAAFLACVLFFVVVFSAKWQVSSSTLTGYVYQRNDRWGYASYSLRFSQSAGMDAQPSFCVASGSEEDVKFQEVLGKDVSVEVAIPSKGFRLANNPFECNSFATLKSIVKEK